MLHLGVIICAKLKVKVSVYFVTSMFSFILRIVSTKPKHENENRIDFDAFYLQEIKNSGAVFFIYTFDNFYSLILPDNIVISLSLVIINANLLKCLTITAHLLQ